jgi:hypothetical protein|tara:strand:- start:835 stop:1011 length:177 start_codon:yes stop_codon:yes gene_type:complete
LTELGAARRIADMDTVSAISNLVFVRCACALRPDSDGRRGDFRDWLDDERKTVGRGIK